MINYHRNYEISDMFLFLEKKGITLGHGCKSTQVKGVHTDSSTVSVCSV